MEFISLTETTGYFDFPSIIGVYLFPDKSCCLIDSGEKIEHTEQACNYLNDRGYNLTTLLSTHFHPDHTAGHQWLQEQQNCAVYASQFEAAILENPELSPFSLYTASPLRVMQNRFLLGSACPVSHKIIPGEHIINGEPFNAVQLTGHTLGHLGWLTPDGVLFAGDSLLPIELLYATKLNYTADVGAHLKTLEYLSNAGFATIVTGHGGLLGEVLPAIHANQEAVSTLNNSIKEILGGCPASIEDVVAHLINQFELPFNHNQYFLIRATASAYLSYLCNQRKITTVLNSGRLLFTIR